jgi:uncharacterized protein
MKPLVLSQIYLYPIKSLGGIAVSTATVLPKGLQYDRRWMLVDEHNASMTQRVYPAMALFKTGLQQDHLIITHTKESLRIPLTPSPVAKPLAVTVWDDTVTAFEVHATYSEWFSEQLKKKCRLVHFPEQHVRQVDVRYGKAGDEVSLADAYPFLIIGQAALDHLNSRLDVPLPMNRFRPNFVFTGGEPHEEDQWNEFRIGNITFAGAKPCARCILTTIDQHTAEKGAEPLKTLAEYRKRGNKILFGQNLIARATGQLRVGDPITVTQRT